MNLLPVDEIVYGLIGETWYCGTVIEAGDHLEFHWIDERGYEKGVSLNCVSAWRYFQVKPCKKHTIVDTICVIAIFLIVFYMCFTSKPNGGNDGQIIIQRSEHHTKK